MNVIILNNVLNLRHAKQGVFKITKQVCAIKSNIKVSCFYSATHAEQRKELRHSGEEDTGNSLVLYCFDPHWLVSLHTCSGNKGTKPKDSAGLFYL